MKYKHNLKVGDKVIVHGQYEGRVLDVLDWSDSLVNVRLDSGVTCVDGTNSLECRGIKNGLQDN